MLDNEWLLPIMLTGSVILLVSAGEIATRRKRVGREDAFLPVTPNIRTQILVRSFSAFVCTIGIAWLIPWAVSLPETDPSGLLAGILPIILLAVGARYTWYATGTGESKPPHAGHSRTQREQPRE